jgi:hypothetical protein
MIDLCHALRSALQEVFLGVPIRACQFHIAQAVLRWQGASKANSNRGKKGLASNQGNDDEDTNQRPHLRRGSTVLHHFPAFRFLSSL